MVLRKPYALLIRYFRRIHLLLIALTAFIFYKTTALRSFLNEFILTESYNKEIESISKYISGFTFFVSFLVLIIVVALIVLLHHKKKPWRLYFVPLVEYFLLIVVWILIKSYFNSYDEFSELTSIMAWRDLLFLVYFPQFAVFIILGIRFFGIDLNKFGFKEDEEYFDIKEEDREEFEVNIEFDKDKVRRNANKLIRHLKYFYFEHQFICNCLGTILFAFLIGYSYYYFGVIHKTYKEGANFDANYFDIRVNNSYLTERKSNGDFVEENSKYAFVVVNLTVKNLGSVRSMNIDRFRLMNRNKESKMALNYQNYFKEYGQVYDNREMAYNEEKTFTLIFQVDKKFKANRFVLYYQSTTDDLLIKKTKLKVEDLRDVKVEKEVTLNEELMMGENDITFTDYKLSPSSTYSLYTCDQENGCGIKTKEISSYDSNILEIAFVSDSFDVKSFVDFSLKYAKIKYEDKDNKEKSIDVKSAISANYTSNALYLKVPKNLADSKSITIVYTRRDKQYLYHLN